MGFRPLLSTLNLPSSTFSVSLLYNATAYKREGMHLRFCPNMTPINTQPHIARSDSIPINLDLTKVFLEETYIENYNSIAMLVVVIYSARALKLLSDLFSLTRSHQ